MNISIKLPNYKYFKNLDAYFDQLELAVFHARKSYEKLASNVSSSYGEEKIEDIMLWIAPVGIDGVDEFNKKIEEVEKEKDKDRMEAYMELMENLEINISF